MLKAFQDYINEHRLLTPGSKVIVAVSGGVDSVVLAHLLWKSGYKIEIAHCHFGLRGKEADDDQIFTMQLAEALNVPFHIKAFNTRDFAGETGISIQMAARRLRFGWFENLQKYLPGSQVALAHHRDDQIETQLLNLLRGTGFPGLRGMKNKRGVFIRPLLFATRGEIESFALANSIPWREDASNRQTKYKRNFVRHKVVPLLSTLNPAYREAFAKLENNACWAEKTLEEKLFLFQKKCFKNSGAHIHVYLMKWHLLSESEFFLKHLLGKYGFQGKDIGRLFTNYPPQTGNILYSPTHQLLINRDHWLISPSDSTETNTSNLQLYVLKGRQGTLETKQFSLKWEIIDQEEGLKPGNNPFHALLSLPPAYKELSLRFWQEGDRFVPLGMKGEKKLSDFFIDNKIDRNLKESIPLLCIDENIAWICGLRPSERFKYTETADKLLRVSFEQRT